MVDEYEPGLMSEAQRFFLLSQTDSLWKEHLQVWGGVKICGARSGQVWGSVNNCGARSRQLVP